MIRFQNCRGVRLFRLGSWQAEVWYCPAGEVIPPHHHEHIDSRIVYLAGQMIFVRDSAVKLMSRWRDRFKFLRVRPNQLHYAAVTGRFGLFLNLEHWTGKPTSAAVDFQPHDTDQTTTDPHPGHLPEP